jgi:hypothetical protein
MNRDELRERALDDVSRRLPVSLAFSPHDRGEGINRAVLFAMAAIAVVLLVAAGGCTPRVHVDPIEVKPIHIVHDINIRVDRQLDEFFAFQEQAATQPATTQATTQTAAGDVR